MSVKPIAEYDAKLLLSYFLDRAPAFGKTAKAGNSYVQAPVKVAQILWDSETDSITPDSALPSWVFTEKLVAKPDQLIKRRGKAGLLKLNADWADAKQWIQERAGKPVTLEGFGIDITDIYTSLVGEENVVSISDRVDADVKLCVGRMRKERLDDLFEAR